MRMLFFIYMLLISSAIRAQNDETSIYVHTYDDLNAKDFAGPGVVSRPGSGKDISYLGALPTPQEMKKLISKAELTKELQSMDLAELDILFDKLLRMPFIDVQRSYPGIDPKKLKKLLSLLQEKKE